jgi:hypothetical protein
MPKNKKHTFLDVLGENASSSSRSARGSASHRGQDGDGQDAASHSEAESRGATPQSRRASRRDSRRQLRDDRAREEALRLQGSDASGRPSLNAVPIESQSSEGEHSAASSRGSLRTVRRSSARGSRRAEEHVEGPDGYARAEMHVPGSSTARDMSAGTFEAADSSRSSTDAPKSSRQPVSGGRVSGGRVSEGRASAGSAASELADSPLAARWATLRRWMQQETQAPRAALVAAGLAAVLLVWGAYMLGGHSTRAMERGVLSGGPNTEQGSETGLPAGPESQAPSAGNPGTTPEERLAGQNQPGGRDRLQEQQGPGARDIDEERTPAGPGGRMAMGGSEDTPGQQPVRWSRAGFLVTQLSSRLAVNQDRARALVAYLRDQGFSKIDWRISEQAQKHFIGIRYPEGLSEAERKELFERVRSLPPVRNQHVTMDFAEIQQVVPYRLPD